MGKVCIDSIDFLTRQIKAIDATVKADVEICELYTQLLTTRGVDKIPELTIMPETGSIIRFDNVGNYVPHCPMVSSKWISNYKGLVKGNKKDGNNILPRHFWS